MAQRIKLVSENRPSDGSSSPMLVFIITAPHTLVLGGMRSFEEPPNMSDVGNMHTDFKAHVFNGHIIGKWNDVIKGAHQFQPNESLTTLLKDVTTLGFSSKPLCPINPHMRAPKSI